MRRYSSDFIIIQARACRSHRIRDAISLQYLRDSPINYDQTVPCSFFQTPLLCRAQQNKFSEHVAAQGLGPTWNSQASWQHPFTVDFFSVFILDILFISQAAKVLVVKDQEEKGFVTRIWREGVSLLEGLKAVPYLSHSYESQPSANVATGSTGYQRSTQYNARINGREN